MKIIWIKLNGYKKFEQSAKMNLDSKVIAILGRNEAGKTSFLEALRHLSNDTPFGKAGVNQELTRGKEFIDSDIVIEAGFLLEDGDKMLLKDIHDAKQAQWFDIVIYADDDIRYRVRPSPKRDTRARKKLHQLLSLPTTVALFESIRNDFSEFEDEAYFVELLKDLETEEETIQDETLQKFTNIQKLLEKALLVADSKPTGKILSQINEFLKVEKSERPVSQAIRVLKQRIPDFLRFTEDDRTLLSSYDILAEGDIPKALDNIAC